MLNGTRKFWIVGGAAVVLAIAGAGAGIAIATGVGGDDQPLTGSTLEDCSAAALAEHPGGTITETEVGDDGAAYGVEVRLADGSQVEVNLDDSCSVIGSEPDDDGPNDKDGPGDD